MLFQLCGFSKKVLLITNKHDLISGSLSGLAVLNQNSRDRIRLVYRMRKIVVLFDE